jgi:Spy/CpxP family protein refolding chaperone
MLAVAEVLTPEQRAKLAEKMEKRRGWMGRD